MRHTLMILTLCALTWLSTGCLHLQQELVLKADNTGDFRLYCSVPTSVRDAWLTPTNEAVSPVWATLFDPSAGVNSFPEKDGFRVSTYKVFESADRTYVHIEGELTNLERALKSGRLGAFTMTESATGEKTLKLSWRHNPPEDAHEDLATLAAGMKLKLAITTPGDIKSTTAPTTDSNTVSWLFDADKDAGFLSSPPTISVSWK